MQKSIRRDTKTHLITAAERLFATRGLGCVSARDIIRAAGARNESALQYHFGSLEKLIEAVFAKRFLELDEASLVRLCEVENQGQTHDLMALLKAGIGPMLEVCLEESGRLYVLFLMQLTADPRFEMADLVTDIAPRSLTKMTGYVQEVLKDLPEATKHMRVRNVLPLSVMLVADYARQVEAGSAAPVEQALADTAACLAGFLKADAA